MFHNPAECLGTVERNTEIKVVVPVVMALGWNLARAEARIAVGALLDRLPNFRLDRGQESTVVGLAFRSPDRLPVRFG
jgi:hypothetical protein